MKCDKIQQPVNYHSGLANSSDFCRQSSKISIFDLTYPNVCLTPLPHLSRLRVSDYWWNENAALRNLPTMHRTVLSIVKFHCNVRAVGRCPIQLVGDYSAHKYVWRRRFSVACSVLSRHDDLVANACNVTSESTPCVATFESHIKNSSLIASVELFWAPPKLLQFP